MPPEVDASTGDAATDTISVPLTTGAAVVAPDGPVPNILGSPGMAERFATIAECVSFADSDHPSAPSSARPEAVAPFATDAVKRTRPKLQ